MNAFLLDRGGSDVRMCCIVLVSRPDFLLIKYGHENVEYVEVFW